MVPTLAEGSRGPFVRIVQQALNLYPFVSPKLEVQSGIFGPKTKAAVQAYQRRTQALVNGRYVQLDPDGIVGPNTRAGLFPFGTYSLTLLVTQPGKGSRRGGGKDLDRGGLPFGGHSKAKDASPPAILRGATSGVLAPTPVQAPSALAVTPLPGVPSPLPAPRIVPPSVGGANFPPLVTLVLQPQQQGTLPIAPTGKPSTLTVVVVQGAFALDAAGRFTFGPTTTIATGDGTTTVGGFFKYTTPDMLVGADDKLHLMLTAQAGAAAQVGAQRHQPKASAASNLVLKYNLVKNQAGDGLRLDGFCQAGPAFGWDFGKAHDQFSFGLAGGCGFSASFWNF